ncbi:BON domain-containing protein [Streptomyces sp. NRRL B-24720]|uniref:BON domain-containing protein n=1 Tax=Streptomyces sp. NRRL B-24720 TaxID=1476876 RepID=UPI0004C90D7E|nr:BON domain-containing protein [Streptomyces sp. NRRL B-24720]
MDSAEAIDYRVARIKDRLASGSLAELGLRIEARGDTVMLSGTLSSEDCLNEALRIAREEVGSVSLHEDLRVVHAWVPEEPEELT